MSHEESQRQLDRETVESQVALNEQSIRNWDSNGKSNCLLQTLILRVGPILFFTCTRAANTRKFNNLSINNSKLNQNCSNYGQDLA